MDRDTKFFIAYVVVMFLVITLIGVAHCGYWVDNSVACQATETMGMRECHVQDRHDIVPALAGCGRDDSVAFDVIAVNSSGQRVNLITCCGAIFKGCTVRSR